MCKLYLSFSVPLAQLGMELWEGQRIFPAWPGFPNSSSWLQVDARCWWDSSAEHSLKKGQSLLLWAEGNQQIPSGWFYNTLEAGWQWFETWSCTLQGVQPSHSSWAFVGWLRVCQTQGWWFPAGWCIYPGYNHKWEVLPVRQLRDLRKLFLWYLICMHLCVKNLSDFEEGFNCIWLLRSQIKYDEWEWLFF